MSTLHKCFGSAIELASEAAGLEIMVRFGDAIFRDQAVEEAARLSGLTLYSTVPYYVQAQRGCEFVLAFAQYSELELAEKIQSFAAHLAKLTYTAAPEPGSDAAADNTANAQVTFEPQAQSVAAVTPANAAMTPPNAAAPAVHTAPMPSAPTYSGVS